jgi:hypothetical protein
MSPVLTRFSPALTPRQVAETVFVARQRLLDALVQRVREAASGPNRHHTLIIGPRGSGKTHLLTLTYYQARDRRDQGERLQVVRLPEDPWTITSYRRLLQMIRDQLAPAGSRPEEEADLEAWLARSADQAGPVVLVVENLDRVLDQIGPAGQHKLRHLLQAGTALLLIASTTTVEANLGLSSHPFHGFFTTMRLGPLELGEARALTAHVAGLRHDEALADYLADAQALTRLRVIAHLTDGQPRVWATLATVMTATSLASLTDLLARGLDDLTPYYHERMVRLAPQPRAIIAELGALGRPLHVADLAARLDMEPKSCARSLGELKRGDWLREVVTPFDHLRDQRRTYYELADPMARLAIQLKTDQARALGGVVDFLLQWFPRHDPDLAIPETAPSHDGLELMWQVGEALARLPHGPLEPYLELPTAVRLALEL